MINGEIVFFIRANKGDQIVSLICADMAVRLTATVFMQDTETLS